MINRICTDAPPRTAAAIVAGVLSLLLARPALAEPSATDLAQARELLADGLRMREQGDPSGALEKLRAANALAHTPVTALELGRDYLALAKLVEARETFLSIARIRVSPEETERSAAARAEAQRVAEELRGRIPSLTVRVSGVPVDTVSVSIDGALVPSEALAAPRLLNPGQHSVSARSTAGGITETTVDLREHEAREVELKIVLVGGKPAEPVSSSAEPHQADATVAHPGGRPSAAIGWALLGAGAAVGATGGILMGVAAAQSKDAADRRDRPAWESDKTLWTAGLVTTVVGSIAAVSGVVAFVVSPRGNAGQSATGGSLWGGIGPSSAEIGGSW
jgi:hypothetical protein